MVANAESGSVRVTVDNLGGIDSRQVAFDPGVTVLTGRNATNRTSLLQAITAGLGGSYGELKSDADEGAVELAFDDETYTRQFRREGEDVVVSGEPYTDDESLVDLFSCLLEVNPARRAVERGDGDALREIIMEPIDTEEITADIAATRRELREVEDRIDEIERRRSNLAALKERHRATEDDLADVESELADVRDAVDEFEADADAAEEAEAVVEELTETREEYESVRNQLETQRSAVESLEAEREETADELSELSVPEAELETTQDELQRLQRRKRRLENAINDLVSIVEFNERLVEDGADALPGTAGESENGPGDVVDELDPTSGSVECWTCGTTVDRSDVEERLDGLRDVVDDHRSERNELRKRIDETRATLSDLEGSVEDRESLEAQLQEIDAEIEEREARIEELSTREAELKEAIRELEAEATESESLRDSELLDRYQRLSELEYDRGQLEEQLDSLEAEIAEISELEDELEDQEAERERLRAELTSLRNRIEDMERSAIDTFNDHMETVLDRLGYENVERVWIERTASGSGRGSDPDSTFTLHIVRSSEDGAVYEDTVDHLSESEREVIGLVVALAGYLVHDIHEAVPVMLLDSLESIDSDRIAALVDYFAEYAPFLLVALLPEDAQALDDDYERVVMDEALA